MEELQKKVLQNCSSAIDELLDFTAILPYLYASNLLTDENARMLKNISISQKEKAQYLVYILPRKAEGWFGRFLDCLQQSVEGTSHADLLKELEVNLDDLKQINSSKQKLVGECAAANEVSTACSSGREEVRNDFVYIHITFCVGRSITGCDMTHSTILNIEQINH